MEGLSSMIQKATSLNRISGFKVSVESDPISHLHYADDTILFLDADREQLDYSLSILKCFEIVSGLSINLVKTRIIGVGNVPQLQTWAADFGCTHDRLPTKYLGVPLGAHLKDVGVWNCILDRFDKRLSAWKGKLLSKGGRLTLIKSTLTSLPIYFLSVFLAPAPVIKAMERKIRKFLWSKGSQRKPYHLVNWELCCKSKEEGGLGLKQLAWMNKALLSKWIWRYGREQSTLWQSVVIEKFGASNTRWVPKTSRLTQGTGCWKRILVGMAKFHSHIRYTVESGTDTRLWLDHWVDGDTLAAMFPNLFRISKQKKLPISAFIDDDLEWCFTFNRVLDEEELHDLSILLGIIGPSGSYNNQVTDSRVWIPDSNGFSVKSCYSAFTMSLRPAQFPHKFIWNKKVPSKTNFFLLTAAHNKCLTIDNLHKRDWQLVNLCPLGNVSTESIDHLLLHCTFARDIWTDFLPLPRYTWIMPSSLLQLAYCWRSLPHWTEKAKLLWILLPAAICWNIWLERNSRSFRGKESNIRVVKNNIRASLLAWSSVDEVCNGLRFQELVFDWDVMFS